MTLYDHTGHEPTDLVFVNCHSLHSSEWWCLPKMQEHITMTFKAGKCFPLMSIKIAIPSQVVKALQNLSSIQPAHIIKIMLSWWSASRSLKNSWNCLWFKAFALKKCMHETTVVIMLNLIDSKCRFCWCIIQWRMHQVFSVYALSIQVWFYLLSLHL